MTKRWSSTKSDLAQTKRQASKRRRARGKVSQKSLKAMEDAVTIYHKALSSLAKK